MNSPTQSQARCPTDVVSITNPLGTGHVVLVCEHATNRLPPELGTLGLSDKALQSHIAWDLGALAVAKAMSAELDAPLIAHRVSRLVYDCNRSPDAIDAIPSHSEYQHIPGNAGLSDAERAARTEQYYTPFFNALNGCIERRLLTKAPPVLVTVHSFTPVYKGEQRDVHVGILHDSDTRLADQILACADADQDGGLIVQRNAPYGPEDGVTFTLTRHALPHHLLNVMIEIRNDLIATDDDQLKMAKTLAGWVRSAVENLAAPQQREAVQS